MSEMHESDDFDEVSDPLDAPVQSKKSSKPEASSGDSPRAVRVGRLDTLPRLREEMARLYAAARRVAGHNPTPTEATKLGWLLNALSSSIVANELSQRLDALERERSK